MAYIEFQDKIIVFNHAASIPIENLPVPPQEGKMVFMFCKYSPDESMKHLVYNPVEYYTSIPIGLLTGSQWDIKLPPNNLIAQKYIDTHTNNVAFAIDVWGNIFITDVVHDRTEELKLIPELVKLLDEIVLPHANNPYEWFDSHIKLLEERSAKMPIRIQIEYTNMTDLTKSLTNSFQIIKHNFSNQVEAIKDSYKKGVEQALNRGFEIALKTILQIQDLGYTAKIHENNLAVSGYATHIQKDGKIYQLPKSTKFKIEVVVKNEDSILLQNISSFHPNIWTEACYGNKLKYTTDNIIEALKRLKTINLDSAFSGDATEKATKIFEQLDTEDKKGGEIWTA